MSYLAPHFDPDIFVGYSHGDPRGVGASPLKTWTEALIHNLRESIISLDTEFDALNVFMDTRADFDDDNVEGLRARVSTSGVLLIVISKRFLSSNWLGEDLDWFRKQVEDRSPRSGRVFIIEAQPTDLATWPEFLRDKPGNAMPRFSFYDKDSGLPWGWPDLSETPPKDFVHELLRLQAALTRRLREMRSRARAPKIDEIPTQQRAASQFGVDSRGRIDVVRVAPTADDLQQIYYEEMRHKALTMTALGSNQLGDVAKLIERFLAGLPEGMEAASVDQIWSRGNTLRRRYAAHASTEERPREPDPARLSPLVAGSLADLVDTFNVYVIGDARGLELDSVRLGPRDRDTAKSIIAAAEPIALATRAADAVATVAAQETLAEQVEAAAHAPADIHGDQAIALAQKTMGNFVSELLRKVYAPIYRFAGAGMTEAVFAKKEVRSGVYRAAGTATFTAISATAAGNWPTISSFVVANAEALKTFVVAAFHNPKLVEIIAVIVRAAANG